MLPSLVIPLLESVLRPYYVRASAFRSEIDETLTNVLNVYTIMSDAIETIDARRGISRTEHALKSVLNGSIETVRSRLIGALEQLGYYVFSADPLHAKRAARGSAPYYLSANILEYPTKLSIGLREIGPGATLVTFDYVSEHPGGLSFKGDLDTQMREAEAIIAIASSDRNHAACSSCGTGQISEGRFCRVCGAPTVTREPAELELLRVAAGGRAGHHLIVSGSILVTIGLLATLGFSLIRGFPGVVIGALLFVAAVGLLLLYLGVAGLSTALNRDRTLTDQPTAKAVAQISPAQPNVLPPPSVTEGTTTLLTQTHVREKELVHLDKRDTSPMD